MFSTKIREFLHSGGKSSACEDVKFNLVIKFTDSDRDDTTCSFRSPEEREQSVDKLLAEVGAKEIISVVYDDTVVFWRRTLVNSTLPTEAPELDGEGELLIKLDCAPKTTFEGRGYTMKQLKPHLEAFVKKYGAAQKLSVIRRTVAFERVSVLVKRGDIVPGSARRIESTEYVSDDE